MPQNDTNFRLEVLEFLASYRQKRVRMARSLETNAEVKSKCSREICEQVFEHEHRFPDLDSILSSQKPVAWKLAKMYEQEVQHGVDLYDDMRLS